MSERTCPRCRQKYSWIERSKRGSRYYAYAIHKNPVDKTIHKCYLGPVDGYVYVSRTHGDIGLRFKGLMDKTRAIEYLNALLNYTEQISDSYTRLRLLSLLQEAIKIMERLEPQEGTTVLKP